MTGIRYWAVTILASLAAAQTCYHPDGSEAPHAVPCTSDTFSVCCGSEAICMSNGICVGVAHQPYIFSRGSCTDKNWGSACGSLCVKEAPSSSSPLIAMGNNNQGNPVYCCDYQASGNISMCSNGEAPFTLDDGNVILGKGALVDAEPSPGVTTSSGVVISPTTSPTTNPSCTADTGSSSDCSSKVTAVGAGVGVPLGVIALSALLWGIWERKRGKSNTSMTPIPAPAPQEVKYAYTGPAAPPPAEMDQNAAPPPELMGNPVHNERFI